MSDKPLRDAFSAVIDGLIITIPQANEDNSSKTSWENLRWMTDTLQMNINTWPVDKISRWIGFIQGVLCARGIMDVDSERDRTRPIFHEAYAAMGLGIPPSDEMKQDRS